MARDEPGSPTGRIHPETAARSGKAHADYDRFAVCSANPKPVTKEQINGDKRKGQCRWVGMRGWAGNRRGSSAELLSPSAIRAYHLDDAGRPETPSVAVTKGPREVFEMIAEDAQSDGSGLPTHGSTGPADPDQ